MTRERLVIEHGTNFYNVCIEIPAMPASIPIKLWQKKCFSEEEVVQIIRPFLRHMTKLLKLPEEVKEKIKQLEESGKPGFKKDSQREKVNHNRP